MKEDKQVGLVRELVGATKTGKLRWDPQVSPGARRYVAILPSGTTFVLTAILTEPSTALGATQSVLEQMPGPLGSVRLDIRDEEGRLQARADTHLPGVPLSSEDPPLQRELEKLFLLLEEQAERQLDDPLAELERLTAT